MLEYEESQYFKDLKDLKHIEWFLDHEDDYAKSRNLDETVRLLDGVFDSKTIYYSKIRNYYKDFVNHFDNNPYNYQFCIEESDRELATSPNLEDYFYIDQDQTGREYLVPFGFLKENKDIYTDDYSRICTIIDQDRENQKKEAIAQQQIIIDKYDEYDFEETADSQYDSPINILQEYKTKATKDTKVKIACEIIAILYVSFMLLGAQSVYQKHLIKTMFKQGIFHGIFCFVGIIAIIVTVVCCLFIIFGILYEMYISRKYESFLTSHKKTNEMYRDFTNINTALQQSDFSTEYSDVALTQHTEYFNFYDSLLTRLEERYMFHFDAFLTEKRKQIFFGYNYMYIKDTKEIYIWGTGLYSRIFKSVTVLTDLIGVIVKLAITFLVLMILYAIL